MKPARYFEDPMTVRFPAWDYDVKVILSSNVDASVKRRDSSHEPGSALAVCMRNVAGNPNCLIVLPYRPEARTVAHESWHAIKNMLDFCGSDYSNETVAYHLGHLVGKITDFARKNPRPYARKKPSVLDK